MWYAAHCVFLFRFRDGVQDSYPVEESIVLVSADSPEAASERALAMCKAKEMADGLEYDGRPADYKFAAVRKVISCETEGFDPEKQPTHGTEITYSFLRVPTAQGFELFLKGERVDVTLTE